MNDTELQQTEAWWNQLSEAKRAEIQQMYDVESKNKFINDREEDEGLELVSIAVYGEFVEEEIRNNREWSDNELWRKGFLEYLHNHEISITGAWGRHFHMGGTCQAHPKAKKALKRGFIPANYTCPYQDKACPMRKLLSVQPGKSLRLLPKFKV